MFISPICLLEVPDLPSAEIHDVDEDELMRSVDAATMSKQSIVEEEEP